MKFGSGWRQPHQFRELAFNRDDRDGWRQLFAIYGATQLVKPAVAESSAVPFTPKVPEVLVF
jgi:hypothetical protein